MTKLKTLAMKNYKSFTIAALVLVCCMGNEIPASKPDLHFQQAPIPLSY